MNYIAAIGFMADERYPLESRYEAAVACGNVLKANGGLFSQADVLSIYALYKRQQAGVSTQDLKPSRFAMTANAKYCAWRQLTHFEDEDGPEDAMTTEWYLTHDSDGEPNGKSLSDFSSAEIQDKEAELQCYFKEAYIEKLQELAENPRNIEALAKLDFPIEALVESAVKTLGASVVAEEKSDEKRVETARSDGLAAKSDPLALTALAVSLEAAVAEAKSDVNATVEAATKTTTSEVSAKPSL